MANGHKPGSLTPVIIVPTTPDALMSDEEVEAADFGYSIRAPEDWVISGPLGGDGFGRGRHFMTWPEAEAWGREFYGPRFKGRLQDEPGCAGRWALLVKGPRGLTNG